MSREDAPNYRVHDCCFYCGYCMPERKDGPYCKKHDFFFCQDEARARICDDYKNWMLVGDPDERG